MVKFETIPDYKGLGEALRIVSEACEVIVPLGIGPRIMHFSVPGGENILEEDASLYETLPDGTEWKIYGGHRLWHSPEAFPRSYVSDSHPLERNTLLEDGVLLVQAEEAWTQMQKEMEVRLVNGRVRIVNRIINRGAWPVEIAVWSLTVGSRGGREVCPVVQRNTGLLPNSHYVSWPYSRLDDSRVRWGQKYIVVDNDENDKTAFKFGYPNEYGWVAYFNKELCFIKKFNHNPEGKYPDCGCSWETYSSYWGIELESLSPLQVVKPGNCVEHVDEWFVFSGMSVPEREDAAIEAALNSIANEAGIELPVISSVGWDPRQ